MKLTFVITTLAASLVLVPASPLRAAQLAGDDFETGYVVPDGTVSGANGGFGFAAWTAPSGQGFANQVRNNSLAPTYPNYVTSTSNYLNLYGLGSGNNNFAQRAVDVGGTFAAYQDGNGRVGQDGTTLWGSFVFTLDNGAATFFLQGVTNTPTINLSTSANNLFVFRITYGAGNADTFSIWNNPTIPFSTATAPTSNLNGDFSFTSLGFQAFNDGEVRVDNIRLGNTVGDVVTVVPEPSNCALLGFAGLAALAMRRKYLAANA